VVHRRAADLRAPGDALSHRRVFVIFNPASGRGRGAKRIGAYRQLLEERIPHVEFLTTTRPGEERDLAERDPSGLFGHPAEVAGHREDPAGEHRVAADSSYRGTRESGDLPMGLQYLEKNLDAAFGRRCEYRVDVQTGREVFRDARADQQAADAGVLAG